MKACEFKQLNTPHSWDSAYSVVAHIDLDAFYSQVQAVTMDLDPTKPLASRQWNSVIAVNYPARDFKVKRGMSIKECRQLCPDIQLPHVPTFKKGSTSWSIEKDPKVDTHKVSLDLFRGESRKIFSILRKNFQRVGKAGIDEAFIDLGPDLYHRVLKIYPQITEYLNGPDDQDIPLFDSNQTDWVVALLEIGSDMIREVRMEIFAELKYTCSSGIASNKLVAKLGSAFKKPFDQTLILPKDLPEFLDKHKFTDLWGWGGIKGQAVLEKLGVEDLPSKVAAVGIDQLFIKFENTEILDARECFQVATGTYKSPVKMQTQLQSMSTLKEFGATPLLTMQDLNEWLVVYCADLVGRLEEMTLEDPSNMIYRPQTLAISYHGGVTRVKVNKQQPCNLPFHKSPLEALSQAVASMIPADKKILPCISFSLKLSNIIGIKPTSFFKVKEPPTHSDGEEVEEDGLFVSEKAHFCKKCRKNIPLDKEAEHKDWHLAKTIQSEINSSPTKPRPTMSPRRSAVQKHPKSPSKKQQPTLLNFFSKQK